MENIKDFNKRLNHLSDKEKINLNGGGRIADAGRWVGCKLKSAWNWWTKPAEPSSHVYEANPNDPLM